MQIKNVVGIAAAAFALTAVVAPAAQATTTGAGNQPPGTVTVQNWVDCPDGYYCLFEGWNGSGRMNNYGEGVELNALGDFHDLVSSVWNRTRRTIVLSENEAHQGANTSVAPGAQVSFDGPNVVWNDRIDSVYSV